MTQTIRVSIKIEWDTTGCVDTLPSCFECQKFHDLIFNMNVYVVVSALPLPPVPADGSQSNNFFNLDEDPHQLPPLPLGPPGAMGPPGGPPGGMPRGPPGRMPRGPPPHMMRHQQPPPPGGMFECRFCDPNALNPQTVLNPSKLRFMYV